MYRILLIILLLTPGSLFAQGLKAPPGVLTVAILPATCTAVGAVNSSAPVRYQGRVYVCSATNTWSILAATGGAISGTTGTFSSLTAGRLPYVGTAGLLSDSANALLDSSGNFTHWGTGNYGNGSAGVARFYFTSATAGLTGWRFDGISTKIIAGISGTSGIILDADTHTLRSGDGVTTFGTWTSTDFNVRVPLTMNAKVLKHALATVTGTDGGTTSLDFNIGNHREVTTPATGNFTIAPSNLCTCEIVISVIQGAGGSHLVTWNSTFKFPGGTAPTLSTAAGAVDVFRFICNGSVCRLAGSSLDVR